MHSKSATVKCRSQVSESEGSIGARQGESTVKGKLTNDIDQILFEELQIASRHKSNYETLKSAFTKLYNAYNQLESRFNLSVSEARLKAKEQADALLKAQNKLDAYISTERTVKGLDSSSSKETLDIMKLKITNELESKYREQILTLNSDLETCQDENRLLVEEVQNLKKILSQERNEFNNTLVNTKLLYEAEITSLRKLRDDQTLEISECHELTKQLDYFKENLSKERDQNQSDNYEQLQMCSDLKAKNMELEALCSTQKHQLNILNEELNGLQNELMNQRQTALESTRCRMKAEQQVEKLLQSTRVELANLRSEAQCQKFDIERQRNELIEKSKGFEHELNLLQSCQPIINEFSSDLLFNQEIMKSLRNHFVMHINEFENKVSSISDRLNLEVDRIQTFQMNAKSIIEKISTTAVYPKSLTSSELHGYNSEDIQSKVLRDNMRQETALCLRIVLLKQKINFLECEIEKLREENIILKDNVSASEYERVSLAYKDLYRRHQEYERIILNSNDHNFYGENITVNMKSKIMKVN
ncbi:unnamed protein product [Heterobilharzia americana]|nr:unnamed protein product [Heterobilharzia americana]